MVGRGWLAVALALSGPALAAPVFAAEAPAQPPALQGSSVWRPANIGAPLGTIDLRVSGAKTDAFMHDLADFADTYKMGLAGEPAGMSIAGREVLLVWFTRPDGLAVLVTDAVQPDRVQAFFYVGPGGFQREHVIDVMHGYRNKMSGYPAFTK